MHGQDRHSDTECHNPLLDVVGSLEARRKTQFPMEARPGRSPEESPEIARENRTRKREGEGHAQNLRV